MGHKKYYGYKPPFEHYEVDFHKDTGKIGQSLDFVYENGRCGMNLSKAGDIELRRFLIESMGGTNSDSKGVYAGCIDEGLRLFGECCDA